MRIICTKCGLIGVSEEFAAMWGKQKERGTCKKCKGKADRIYQQKNKEVIAKYHYNRWRNNKWVRDVNKLSKEKSRFGIDATAFVKNKKCEIRSMTDEQHKNKWGERLQIHHKDGNGRATENSNKAKNNDINNYKIVCRACHCAEENYKRDYTSRGLKAWETRRKNEQNN